MNSGEHNTATILDIDSFDNHLASIASLTNWLRGVGVAGIRQRGSLKRVD